MREREGPHMNEEKEPKCSELAYYKLVKVLHVFHLCPSKP